MDGVEVENVPTVRYPARPAREENRPLSLSVPGILTPEQFFQRATNSARIWTGERRLLSAVLHNAVESLFRYRHDYTLRGRRLFQETHEWFWASHAQGLYSFESICAHLHLDADYIQGGLKRLYDPTAVSFAPVSKSPRKPRALNPHLTVVHGGKVEETVV
jgi:hypothetical protein